VVQPLRCRHCVGELRGSKEKDGKGGDDGLRIYNLYDCAKDSDTWVAEGVATLDAGGDTALAQRTVPTKSTTLPSP